MATEYMVFTDRREPVVSSQKAGDILSPRPLAADGLERLRRIDWRHPVLVVYREDGDDRWSYVTIGLNTPELGDGEG